MYDFANQLGSRFPIRDWTRSSVRVSSYEISGRDTVMQDQRATRVR